MRGNAHPLVVMGWLVTSAVVGAVGAGGCGAASPDGSAAPAANGQSATAELVRSTAATPPTPFVTDRALVGSGSTQSLRLGRAASPALFGWTSPLAVPSSDGRYVAYSAWQQLTAIDPEESFSQQKIESGQPLGRPSIRVVDLSTGEDSLVDDGAFSVAWRGDGAFAYSKGTSTDFRANVPYTSNIVVRRSLEARPEVWTAAPGRYIVLAWASDTLLAYAMHEGEQLDLLALTGPGSSRVLASDASLVAVSPDGTRALVSDASGAMARLFDIASGEELARLDPPTASSAAPGPPNQPLSYGGSWTGDRIVAERAGGLVVIDVSGTALTLERTLAMPAAALPLGVHEPQFADGAGSRVIAWAPVPGGQGRATGHQYVYVDCDVAGATCRVGPPRRDRIFSQTYNPSRPEVDR